MSSLQSTDNVTSRLQIKHSIVMCTAKEPNSALDTILRLKPYILYTECTELILINNGVPEYTEIFIQACESICKESALQWRVVFEPKAGIANARNRALAEATGAIISFLDDDVVPTSLRWQQRTLEVFESDPALGMVGGPIVLEPPSELPDYPWWRSEHTDQFHSCFDTRETGYCSAAVVAAGNTSYRRESVSRLRFSNRLGWNTKQKLALAGEETLFNQQLEMMGWKCWYDTSLAVLHGIEASRWRPSWVLKRALIFGKTSAVFAFVHGETRKSIFRSGTRWAIKAIILCVVVTMRGQRSEGFSQLCHLCSALGRLSMLGVVTEYSAELRSEIKELPLGR